MKQTLTGNNGFVLHSELKRRIDEFVAEFTDMGLERLDGEDVEFDRMREALESLPFLASKKLVVLETPGANKQFVEKAEKLLSNVPDTTDVVIVEPKLDKRSSYYKYLQKNTEYKEFGELDENGLARWLVDRAKVAGGSISQADARYLIDRIGVNQQLATSELDKLLLYDPKVTRQTIDLLVEPTPQSSIFDLMDAAFSGKLERAMELYAEQRTAKVEPQQIMAMVAWQMHILALIKAAGDRDPATIAKEAKVNPFVVRKSSAIVRRLSLARIKELAHEALVLDTRLKSESLDADDALQHYLILLAR